MTLQPGSRLGNYQILEKIGAGGMGSVFKAYQPALGRYVAIKVLPPQTAGDPSFSERFALEARAIGKLRHPNIVTAYDFAQEGDLAYLVSDYIDGGTLFDQLGAPLPRDYVVAILTPIAAALDYAHVRGVVHRDIKPQNILLSHDGVPVLTDFGLAKIVGPGSGVTQAGALMGTAEYIAPECASGASLASPASDQYAVAIVAYQMLAGRHPFPSDNPLSALMAHVHKPVPAPSSLGVTLPPHVEAALLRGLAKTPEQRFARVSDFVRALAAPTPAVAPTPPIVEPTPASPPPRPSLPPPPSASAVPIVAGSSGSLPPADASLSVPVAVSDVAMPARKKTPWWRRWYVLVPAAIVAILFVIGVVSGSNEGTGRGGTTTTGHTQQTAIVIGAGTRSGTIAPAGTVDFYRVNASAGTNISVELHLGTLTSGSIAIIGQGGQVLDTQNDVSASGVGRVSYSAKDAGAYFIRVRGGRGEPTGTYSIVVTLR